MPANHKLQRNAAGRWSGAARLAALALVLAWTPAPQRLSAEELPRLSPPTTANGQTNSFFSSSAEALGMLVQVVGNLEEFVRSKELTSLHSEDLILNASVSALTQQATRLEPARRDEFRSEVTRFARQVAALHIAGDTQQQRIAEQELARVLDSFNRVSEFFPTETRASAQAAASQYRCPGHRDVLGRRSDTCPKCGSPLDQRVRILPAFCGLPMPSAQSVRASIRLDPGAAPDQPATAILNLSKTDGSPVRPSDLLVTHMERIHLLLVDASLSDYQHEHPRPTRVPGEYSFPFTPRKPGIYFAWADVRPAPMGLQEYAPATIAPVVAGNAPAVERTVANTVVADGLRYELSFLPDKLKAERPAVGRLYISRMDGTPFDQLEPFMAAFAHLVGFGEDRKTILHLHPKTPPALKPEDRGGPELEFRFHAGQAGFYRLFVQIQIEGASRFIPFGVQVGR